MSINPTNYDVQVYPLGQSGALAGDDWALFSGAPSIRMSFVSGLAVRSIWLPNPDGQPLDFYAGPTVSGTPFYSTDGAVPEIVAIPNAAPVVTIATHSGMNPSPGIYLYASTIPYAPFRAVSAPTLNVTAVAPIENTGTPSVPIIALSTPLAISYGGTGTTVPSLVAGSNITISGLWPNQTIAAVTAAGGVQSVIAGTGINTGGTLTNPVVNLITPVSTTDGGTGTTTPYFGADLSGILVNSGTANDSSFQWQLSLGAFLKDNSGATVVGVGQLLQDGGITVTKTSAHAITLDTTALVPVATGITSTGGSITVTPHTGSQTVNLETSSPLLPVYTPNGTQDTSPTLHIVRSNGGSYSLTYTVTSGTVAFSTTTATFSGSAAFTSGVTYAITFDVYNVTGTAIPVFVLEAVSRTGSGCTFQAYGIDGAGSGSGTVTFDIIAIGH